MYSSKSELEYKLLDWVPLKKILTDRLSSNPHIQAINILKEYPGYIDFTKLCKNPCKEAFDIIINNLDKIMVSSLCAVENINIVDVLENKLNKKQKKRYDWTTLSSNPYAIQLLEKNFEKINWFFFSSNPDAIHIIEKNLKLVDMEQLARNPNIYLIIDKIIDNTDLDWDLLSQNSGLVEYFNKNWDKVKDKINWTYFSRNQNINAIKILEPITLYLDKICWETLSENINACDLIEKNWEYCKNMVDWCYISANPSMTSILEKNIDKINWTWLSSNPSIDAMNIIKNNLDIALDNIDWKSIASNPAIFELCD
jgi:hypothetical protein